MSQQEKNDLYQAIGYSESDNIVDMSEFDKTYVGFELTAELKKVGLKALQAICFLWFVMKNCSRSC